ncbi:hypothetical protein BOX15_Mlig019048g2 [Macrostomum lignano]|uniref:RING-type domain-containing protein n=1 Tax=Macrostomum lignano TaxID=282301 RepID=A0A267FYK2_9PLAT|nr:hypothetical protein BOX15_Mlig019048g2 [Macrostomum lignano]
MGNSCITRREDDFALSFLPGDGPHQAVHSIRRISQSRFIVGSGGFDGIPDLMAPYGSRAGSVRQHIRQMLKFVVQNYDNDAKDLQKRNVLFQLHGLSASERPFLLVIDVLLDEVPIDHSLSSSIVAMVICGGCLPTKELLTDFMSLLGLSTPSSETRQKNALTAVAAFAGRLSGALSDWLATDALLAFVHSRLARLCPAAVSEAGLRPYREPSDPGQRAERLQVALAAALLLQTFMHTFCEPERQRLLGRLSNNSDASVCRPSFVALLSELEWRFGQSGHGPARQLSCLSTGLLDGYLRPAGRLSAWLAEPALSSRARVCCLLSPTESTDAVQILPSGLEARSDAPGFETAVAACSVGVGSGNCCRWYFEVTLVTAGVMQIGWASTDTPLLRDEGLGVGDDAASVAIDGCRCCLWHRGRQDKRRYRWRRWRVGDVVGCLLEFSANQQQQQQPQSAGGWAAARFSLNGAWSSAGTAVRLPAVGAAYRPAASLMASQQLRFNFGGSEQPFRYRPPISASTSAIVTSPIDFAAEASGVSSADRRLLGLPWPLAVRERRFNLTQTASPTAATCIVCVDRPGDVRLMPCGHTGLCRVCSARLSACPFCRVELAGIE